MNETQRRPMPHTLALNIFAASFLEQTRAFLRLASAEHCIVHRRKTISGWRAGAALKFGQKTLVRMMSFVMRLRMK